VNDADLVRLVDEMEDAAETYLTLEDVQRRAGADLSGAVADGLLLVDYRTREDGSTVTLCRLNRRHPLVMRLTAW
jgi:hypothetical protein